MSKGITRPSNQVTKQVEKSQIDILIARGSDQPQVAILAVDLRPDAPRQVSNLQSEKNVHVRGPSRTANLTNNAQIH